MEKYDFIKLMLRNRNLSVNDKKRLLLLATREIEQADTSWEPNEEKQKKESKEESSNTSALAVHAPKDTASFLSLFNDPNGFKFLTHDFDPNSDMNYDKFIAQVKTQFKEAAAKYKISTRLWSIMNVFITGKDKDGKDTTWLDCDGNTHKGNFASKDWAEWARNNNLHPLSNKDFSKDILMFRSSIRLVKPKLHDIVSEIVADIEKRYPNLVIQTLGLEKADFYTHVWYLKDGIRRILEDMSRYAEKTPKVNISFERKFDDEFSLRIIKITQIDSVSYSLDEVVKRFYDKKKKGGAFNSIKKDFYGYCNWSVESLWDGKAKRWNILKDADVDEIEDMDDTNVPGFTHILTYFSK